MKLLLISTMLVLTSCGSLQPVFHHSKNGIKPVTPKSQSQTYFKNRIESCVNRLLDKDIGPKTSYSVCNGIFRPTRQD